MIGGGMIGTIGWVAGIMTVVITGTTAATTAIAAIIEGQRRTLEAGPSQAGDGEDSVRTLGLSRVGAKTHERAILRPGVDLRIPADHFHGKRLR
jgi:hypothetical protein